MIEKSHVLRHNLKHCLLKSLFFSSDETMKLYYTSNMRQQQKPHTHARTHTHTHTYT